LVSQICFIKRITYSVIILHSANLFTIFVTWYFIFMHIISFRKLRDFFEVDPNSKVPLQDWYKRAGKAEWDNFSDVKKTFNSVDSVGNSRYVFNVKGNHYRIVVLLLFQVKRVYIRWVGTHKDYSKIKNIDKI